MCATAGRQRSRHFVSGATESSRSADDRAARGPREGYADPLAAGTADHADLVPADMAMRACRTPIRSALWSARSGVQRRSTRR